jgi:hypothetical protein
MLFNLYIFMGLFGLFGSGGSSGKKVHKYKCHAKYTKSNESLGPRDTSEPCGKRHGPKVPKSELGTPEKKRCSKCSGSSSVGVGADGRDAGIGHGGWY